MSSPRINLLKRVLKFPLKRITKDGSKLKISHMNEKHMDSAYKIFLKYIEHGKGMSQDEFTNEDEFRARLTQTASFYCENVDTKEIIGMFNLSPSPLSRSVQPITHAGYVVLDPSMLNKGYGYELMSIYWIVGRSMGYKGLVGRTSSMNPSILSTIKRVPMEFTGYIPSSYQSEGRWYDDCLCTMDTSRINMSNTGNEIFENQRPIPENPSQPTFNERLIDSWDIGDLDKTTGNLQPHIPFVVSQATHSERFLVDQLIYKDAMGKEGGGFAIDEFNETGSWSRNLLYKDYTLVMKHKDTGEIMASAIIGPSSFSRSKSPVSMGIYIITSPTFRRFGAATLLVKHCENIADRLGFHLCVSDVYNLNGPGIRLAHTLGYTVSASIPKSGYFHQHQYVDSLLFFKNLHQKSIVDRMFDMTSY